MTKKYTILYIDNFKEIWASQTSPTSQTSPITNIEVELKNLLTESTGLISKALTFKKQLLEERQNIPAPNTPDFFIKFLLLVFIFFTPNLHVFL